MTDATARGAGPAERAHHAGGDGPAPEGAGACRPGASRARCCGCCAGRIWSWCRAIFGVPAAELSAWRDAFLAAGEASLEDPVCRWPRPRDRPPQGQGRGSDHGQRVARGEDRAPGGRPPFGTAEVEAMSMVVSPSANRSYGVQRVTRVWGGSRATLYRHRRCDQPGTGRRPRPARAHAGRSVDRSDPRAAGRQSVPRWRATGKSGHDCASPASAPPGGLETVDRYTGARRVAVEHVFATQKCRLGLLIRTVGLAPRDDQARPCQPSHQHAPTGLARTAARTHLIPTTGCGAPTTTQHHK